MTDSYEVGKKLVELCRKGKNLEAVDSLFAPDAESLEVMGDETMPARVQGIEAIRGKNKWFFENHEIHKAEVTGPFPHGDQFIAFMGLEVTPKTGKMKGQRIAMQEACLYTVNDQGKIAREEFFYHHG